MRRISFVAIMVLGSGCTGAENASDGSSGSSSGAVSSSSSSSSTTNGSASSTGGGATVSLVSGRVLSPSGSFGLFDALVSVDFLDANGLGAHLQTHTRFDGQFKLSGLPAGEYRLNATRGRYTGAITLTLGVDTDTVTDADIVVSGGDTHFVVVSGSFDSIEDILGGNGLGFEPVLVDGWNQVDWVPEVVNATYLQNVDAVFLNCGIDDSFFDRTDLAERRQVLLDYVEAGGGLYISDWAYDVMEWLFPDALDFYDDDTEHDVAQIGQAEEVTAVIEDVTLQKLVGRTVQITYDLGSWAILEDADTAVDALRVEVLARATVHTYGGTELENVPLAASVGVGSGTVIYTTFHNEAQLDPTVEAVLQYMVMNL
jgi:hypothetical protein